FFLSAVPFSFGQTTWTAGANTGLYSTAGNWNNGVPSTGPQLSIFDGNALINQIRTIDIAGTPRNSIGIRFDFTAADDGFTFNSSGTGVNIGLQSRAGGAINGILNNDNSTQIINVPFRMFTSAGAAGAGAAQTISAASGDIIFSGNYPGTSTNSTIHNNGGDLTVDGTFNTTVGTTGRGDIFGPGGLVKNGAGRLTLGGTMANTYSGGTVLNAGTATLAKANALGSGRLTLNGGLLETGGFSQTLGTLNLDSNSTIDFGAGDSDLAFADSDAEDWTGGLLTIVNWTDGVDSLRIGNDGTGFDTQVEQIRFADYGNAPGQIDANGFVSPIPEPSTWALIVLGGVAWAFLRRRA
ncbi:MAG TPA: autotransporter-associated beta strand repeat-containing protein, partial [Candidatus Acidoferrum sp.]|nr:autotransporter-associated beta strand repeat-containing protein [Candidatus Acidoferrum sp.]